MPIGKFNTSILEQEARTFNTSILADEVDMTPEDTARAQIQFEEEKPDFTLGRLFHAPWDELKKSVADVARGLNLPTVYAKPEQELARVSRDEMIDPAFSPHEIWEVKADIQKYRDQGYDFKAAKSMAMTAVAQKRGRDARQVIEAHERHLLPDLPSDDVIKATRAKSNKKSAWLEAVATSRFLEMDPEFERSSGFIEDVLRGVGSSVMPIGAMWANPVLGAHVMYEQIKGAKYEALVQEGVDPERATLAAQRDAAAQTPMEFLGDMFVLKAALGGSRPWVKLITDIASAAGAEGLTEFAQQYPEELATYWAMNPDMTMQDAWREMTSLENLKSAAYSGLVGAAAGGLMAGGGHGAKKVLDRYVLEPQRKKNEERADLVLGALKKLKEGAALSTQEQDALGGLGLPQAFVDRMYYQTPVDTENRDKVYDGLLKSNITKEQADTYMTIFDAIAHHYAEVTGQTPEAFYDVELVDYRVGKYDEFNVDEERKAAQTKTQYQGSDWESTLARQREIEGLRAAIKDPATGKIYTGGTHQAAIDSAPKYGTPEYKQDEGVWGRLSSEWDRSTNNVGFVDSKGNFISRDEAEERLKVSTMEDVRDFIRNRKPYYQAGQSSQPLGATVFTSSGAIISAFEGNNVSTPIHEVGHVLTDLISRYDQESFAILAKYLGKDPAKGMGSWTTADHEKLAKAFETYMMQGKAPSFRLVHAFKQMRTWLLELYRRVTKLGAKVTPEIRSVFDKWLTTEDEKLLDEMSDITNLMDEQSPYYEELKKLKTEAIREYAELAAKAQAIVNDKDRKKRIIELKHVRAQLRKQAEEIIDGMPYYQDIKTLREEGRFSEDIIRRMRNYGEDHLQVFREKGVMTKNGKLSPDAFVHEVVYSYGREYDTPEEFLDLVLEMPTRKNAIEQQYQELLSDFNESLEAEGLVFDDAEAVIDAEIQLLYAMLGKSPVRSKILSREIKKREEFTEDDVRDLKKVAADLERTAREAFDQGAKEEREIQEEAAAEIQGKQKADIAALKEKQKEKLGELRQKNLEKVIALKEKQKEAIRKLREQNRIGQEKKKIMARMKKHIKRSGMIYENRQQLQALLARYFKVGKYTPDDTLPTLQGFFEAKIDPETQAGEVIQGILQDLPDPRRDAAGEVIARNKSGGAKGSPWALADLETIAQVADMIVALDASERSNTTEVVKQERANLVDHIYAMADMKPSFLPDGQIKVRQAESWMDRVRESGADLYASLRRIEFFCNFLDGFEKTGLAWARIFKPTADAENHELRLHEAYDTKIAAIMNQFISDASWFKQEHDFFGLGGMINKLSRQNAFMIALNSGNEHNLNYLREGNRVPQQTIDYIWDEFLTEQEKTAVHEIWALFDTLYPMLNDINKAILGAPLKKVEGHYFPIKTDYKDPERGHIARKREDEQLARDTGFGPHSFAYPEHGFRKERSEGMKEFPSLLLEASVITTHLDRAIHDISHTLPLLEVYRLIRDPEVMKAIKDVAGENMYDQLTPWLRSISRPVSEPLAWQERVSRHLRKNTSIVGMGLKMTVAALQPLDLFSTWHELGLKATARGIGKFFGGGFLRTSKAIDDVSIMMRYRRQAYDREVADFKRKLLDRGGTWRSLHDYYFAFCGAMDDLVAYPTWQTAFDEASQKYLLPDGSVDEEKAIDFADSTVRRVLGAGRAKDLPNAMKGSEMKKFWTMFYTWANKFENQMMELQAKTGRRGLTDPKMIAELMKAALLLVVIPAYLSMFLYKRRLPEDEEWATWLLAYRCQGIPIVRDLAGFMSGYDMRMPLSDAYKSLVSVGKDFGKVKGWVVDDEDLDAYKIAKHVGTAAGYIVGLPTAQAFVTIDGALDLLSDKSDNPVDLLFRAPRESKKKEEAYY